MPLSFASIFPIVLEAVADTQATIAFEKTIPANIVGVERDLALAEFIFPNVLKLMREVLAANKA